MTTGLYQALALILCPSNYKLPRNSDDCSAITKYNWQWFFGPCVVSFF